MKITFSSIIYSFAIIVTALILGNAVVNRNDVDGVIAVTGLGEKNFSSDLIVWEGSFTRTDYDMKLASTMLSKDKAMINDYLTKNGISTEEIVFSAIDMTRLSQQRYTPEGKFLGNEFSGFSMTQSLQISSKDIDKVENISRNITELLLEGIQFNSNSPRYYYSKLSDLKIELVSAATKDARERAEKIAEEAGSKIRDLQSAQMGIIQITGLNSNEDYSWGGTYNTSSKEKTASITMKLTYQIK